MKKFIATVLLASVSALHAQDGRKEVLPEKVQFDTAEAKQMLALGNSTITGIAVAREYTNANGNILNNIIGQDVTGIKHVAPPGTVVMLFPMTDYFKEYLRLRDRYKQSRKYKPVLSPEAFSYRLESKIGDDGRFTFQQMKPGKYYLETYFQYTGTGVGSKVVGRNDYYNGYGAYMGSNNVYQSYYYNYNDAKVEKKIVTVKQDGQVLEVKL